MVRRTLLLFLLALATPAQAYTFESVEWVRCYDGDSCTFNLTNTHPLFGTRIPVRLLGIDTPEIRGKCEAEKVAARVAKEFVTDKLRRAKTIDLRGAIRGKYFRIVADVTVDGQSLSEMLLHKGLAVKYDGGRKTPYCEGLS